MTLLIILLLITLYCYHIAKGFYNVYYPIYLNTQLQLNKFTNPKERERIRKKLQDDKTLSNCIIDFISIEWEGLGVYVSVYKQDIVNIPKFLLLLNKRLIVVRTKKSMIALSR